MSVPPEAAAWEISWVDMCRTCMEVDGELLPLHGDEAAELGDYAYKLGQIAAVEVSKFDGLPSKICDKCAYRTNAFYDFQCLIRESEKRLKEIFNAQYSTDDRSQTSAGPADDVDETQNQDCFFAKDEMMSDSYGHEKFQIVFQAMDRADGSACAKELEDNCNSVVLNVETNEDAKLQNIQVVFPPEKSKTVDPTDDSECTNDQNDSGLQQSHVLPSETVESKDEVEPVTNITFSEDFVELANQILGENEMSNLSCPKIDDNANNNRDDGDSDSDDYLDTRENIIGSISDTITRIKEIKENGKVVLHQCTLCLSNYSMLSEVLCHIVDMHVPITGPFYCVVCEMDCKDIKELRAHVKTHKGPSPYSCFLCNKSYVMKRYLKRHMACHTDFSRYRCTKCGQRFKIKKELECHINSEHAEETLFKCSQCTRVFNHKGNYKRHLISHLDPKGLYLPKYPCTFCEKRFLNNRTLTTHMRVHTGEKPYQCEICHKKFSQQGNLLSHSKIHTNPRNFKCDVCGKRFNQKSTLRDHKLLHSGEKPYVCSVCGHSFTFSAALRRHMWSHTDGKPYQCDICKAKFIGKYDMKRHLTVHMGKTDSNKSKQKKKKKSNDTTVHENGNKGIIEVETVEQIFLCEEDNLQMIPEDKSEKESPDSLLVQY